jgi:trimeric autotransporter adhesin
MSTAGLASAGSVAALDGRVTALESNMRKAFEGSAVAIAMGGVALPDNKKFAISANWGNFSGEDAFGGMAQFRVSNNFVANAAVGAGFARGGVGGRVGGTFAW